MVIEWLDKYYFFFGVLLLMIAFVKVLGASAFLHREDRMAGTITLLFRWFSDTDYHVYDAPWQIKNMRVMNVVSLLFYGTFLLFIIITIMIKLFR